MQTDLLFNFEDSSSFKEFMTSLEEGIKKHLGESVFFAWFRGIKFKSYDGTTMVLTVKNHKIKNCIFLHYQTKFERIIEKVFVKHFRQKLKRFVIQVEEGAPLPSEEKAQNIINNKIDPSSKFNIGIDLEKKYTFANFLESEENKLTVGLAKHFANLIKSENEDILHFSKQFYICGNIGNGKTHLAQAIGNEVQNQGLKVLYTTSERFLFNFQTAVKKNETIEFTKSFLGVKLLIIDDIHFIATKKKTIEELKKVAYSIIADGGLVLFCSSNRPEDLMIENKSVKSFFTSSHLVSISNPTESFRYDILKFKISKSSYKVADPVLKILACKIQTSIRELEGAMGRIVLHSQILNNEISSEASDFITTDIFPHKELKNFSIEEIQQKVSKYFGISIKDIKSKKRTKAILKARQISIYLSIKLTTASYVEIGKHFNRTHSTVIHSNKAITKEVGLSRSFKDQVNSIKISIEQNLDIQ